MAQNFFDTGFGPAPSAMTGARGTEGGTRPNQQYQDAPFSVSGDVGTTGAPGSTPGGTLLDPGHGDVTVTDFYGNLNGSDAPGVTGTTATSWETGTAALGGEHNPVTTGTDGRVTNGSERISHRD